MEADKNDLINILNMSAKELRQNIETHCCLVNSILEDRVDERDFRPILDMCPKRTREIKLEQVIREAIDELEETRKAFKSKRLEALRKKLTHALIENV